MQPNIQPRRTWRKEFNSALEFILDNATTIVVVALLVVKVTLLILRNV